MHGHPSTPDEACMVLAEMCPAQWVTLHNTTLFTTIPTKYRLHVCGKYHCHECMKHAKCLLCIDHVALAECWTCQFTVN